MKCDKCGNIMPDNARFCTVCGNAFIDVEAEETTVLRGGDDMMTGGMPGGNSVGNTVGGNAPGSEMSGGYSTGLVPMRNVRKKEEIVIDYEFPGGDYSSTNVQQRRDDYWMYDRPTTRDYVNPTPGGGYVGQVRYGNGYGVPVNYENDNRGYGAPQQGYPQGGQQGYPQGGQQEYPQGGQPGYPQGQQVFPQSSQQGPQGSGRRPAQDISQKLAQQEARRQERDIPPTQGVSPKPPKPPKNNGKNKALPFIIIGIAAAVILAAAAVGFFAFKDKIKDYRAKSNSTYIYVADYEYKNVVNAKKGITAEFDELGTDYLETPGFDPDGKYFYYFTKYDKSAGYGVLNRVKVNKLGKNSDKNNDATEEISSKVSGLYKFMPDGTFFYVKEGTMYYYDGRTSKKLDKNVSNIVSDEKGEFIVYQVDDGDADHKKLYYADMKDFNNRILLADDVSGHIVGDKGQIYYIKSVYDSDTYDFYYELYVTNKNKNSKVISDDVYDFVFDVNAGQVFYTVENGKKTDPNNAYSEEYQDLYLYDGNDSKLITSDNKKVKLSYGYDNHSSATSISENGECTVTYAGDGKSYNVSSDLESVIASDIFIYNVEQGPAYYDDDNDTLYICRKSGNNIELEEKLTTVKDASVGDEGVYFLYFSEKAGDNDVCDIYLHKDGSDVLVGSSVTAGDTTLLYPDGTIVEYKDDDTALVMNPAKKLEYEVNDNKGDIVYNGVKDFYFISDRDLYHYNGKTDKLIDTDVEYIISSYEYTPIVIF